ncbi:MAG: UDP-N-acetylmuramoyl-L-alanyl-D-glutamate--2,6-diaminopimelate ligase [Proteobacteria bacterium]|nr:UDP-N-acetylmuramoyl-L-alanyl-D-glutamate--2,6-diaminopimelate ligase [Pseudomonadota bacterium]
MSMPAERITSSPLLAELLQGYAQAPSIPVSGIASDSRQLGEDYLFLACQGLSSHGIDYLEEAIAAGVCAIAWDSSTTDASVVSEDVAMIGVADLAAHLGEIANRFYGRPSANMKVFGVTGTNGKTTVAWLIAQCLQRLGHKCAYLGTLGFGIAELQGGEDMTTPPAVEMHQRLASFVAAGAEAAAVEVSSHALSQGRVNGVRFESALFTNLTRDHLDYHKNMHDYFESKVRLFLECDTRNRIVNLDSEFGTELAARCGQNVVTVSTEFNRVANGRPYVFVRSVVASDKGSNISFTSSWGDGQFVLPLPGDFNVANAAIVLALLLSQGVSVADACAALAGVDAPPGRMQRVAAGGAAVYIDYAHTPNAIEVTLRALRLHCRGKLWCVFGCGGDRDAGKRPLMGRRAERLADQVVITNDNPRGEDPQNIIDEIYAGLVHPESAVIIEDRAAAIAWVISQADGSDTVLIAGKGHEEFQQVGDERLRFSDYAVALAALEAGTGQE